MIDSISKIQFCIFQSIKLEPNTAIVSESWEESNQSYEDGGGGPGPGGGSNGSSSGLPTTNDNPLSLSIPLHSDLSDSAQLHESSRVSVLFFVLCFLISH